MPVPFHAAFHESSSFFHYQSPDQRRVAQDHGSYWLTHVHLSRHTQLCPQGSYRATFTSSALESRVFLLTHWVDGQSPRPGWKIQPRILSLGLFLEKYLVVREKERTFLENNDFIWVLYFHKKDLDPNKNTLSKDSLMESSLILLDNYKCPY